MREISGQVTEKKHDYTNTSLDSEITLYTITQKDGTEQYGALRGHHAVPDLGDAVMVHLRKNKFLEEKPAFSKKDGRYSFSLMRKWEEIKRYAVFETRLA